MSGGGAKLTKKIEYVERVTELFRSHEKMLLVSADNIGSSHLQRIRQALRSLGGQLLMGKNSLIRRSVRSLLSEKPDLEAILPRLVGNVGIVFCKADLLKVKEEIDNNRVGAAAKAGAIAPCDVVVPAGNTGLEPTQTSFLQALNIASKISRGQIEILNDVPLITAGDKVGGSEAVLLQKLKILPFSYGLVINWVYEDGDMYSPSVLNTTDEEIVGFLSTAIANIAAIGLGIGVPNTASVPHSIANAYKNITSVSLAADVPITRADIKELKELLENPEALAAAQAAASSSAAPASAAKEEAKVEEEEEEEDEDMGMGMFGDDDDGW